MEGGCLGGTCALRRYLRVSAPRGSQSALAASAAGFEV